VRDAREVLGRPNPVCFRRLFEVLLCSTPPALRLRRGALNGQLAGFHAIYSASKTTANAMSSALNKAGILVGLYSAVYAAILMVPFALSVLSGVISGTMKCKALIIQSKVIETESDMRKFNIFMNIIIFMSCSIVCVPIMIVPIFMYQSYAPTVFVLTVLGVFLFIAVKFAESFDEDMVRKRSKRWVFIILEVISFILMILGVVLWMVLNPEILRNALDLLESISLSAMTILNLVTNFLFNMFLSKIVTLNVTVFLTGKMFANFDKVYYEDEQKKSVLNKLKIY